LRRLRLTLEYDGSAYRGFQRQRGQPTVQETLERALAQVTQEDLRVVAAGRTDSGVHALGQVVHLDTESALDLATLRRALNAVLPEDIAVREVQEAEAGFHARFSARLRKYRYRILNAPVRSPLNRRLTAQVAQSLDVAAMQRAADQLVGDHDFASFGGRMWEGGSSRRVVYSLDVRRAGDEVIVDIAANAYLSRMVRSIVGCLISVGLGELSADDVGRILAARDRGAVRRLAPPQGLCLMEVVYTDTQLVRSKG